MRQTLRLGTHWAAGMALGLLLPTSGARADALAGYSVQVLAQVGKVSGNFTPRNFLFLSQLNDHGQMILLTDLNPPQASGL
jgi:hypothetical protein